MTYGGEKPGFREIGALGPGPRFVRFGLCLFEFRNERVLFRTELQHAQRRFV